MINYAQEIYAVKWLLNRCWMALLGKRGRTILRPEHRDTMSTADVVVDASILLPDFSCEEMLALIQLQQRYQNGGSDRAEIVRRLELLKEMVEQRKIES